ncbi:MAG: hypothetical protein IJ087_08935 [Eggerthellaceae bacterium]|nr:hypothetical protein [Eggerthellaceae bacterium]
MAPEATIDKANSVRYAVRATRRVNVTELARGKAWRDELPECDVMEIVDRGANAGWLVSDAGMGAMLDTIDYLEARLEQASMAAIVNARRDYDDWMEGDDLARAALAALDERGDDVRAVLDAG